MRPRKGSTRRHAAAERKARPSTTEAVGPGRLPKRWPVARALVPEPDVWHVSGAGRTLVARRRPDGRIAWASLVFDLKRPSSILLFGSVETEEGTFEEIVEAVHRIEDATPTVEGSAALAARFAWAAIAHARRHDPDVGPLDASLLSVFETPRDEPAFDGADGLGSPDLLEHCRREAEACLDEGQSLAVHVAMEFRVPKPGELGRALAADGDFVPARADAPPRSGAFGARGPVAADTGYEWRPRCAAGRRLGSVSLDGGSLEAETVSLDLAGRLCGQLKRLTRAGIELVRIERNQVD